MHIYFHAFSGLGTSRGKKFNLENKFNFKPYLYVVQTNILVFVPRQDPITTKIAYIKPNMLSHSKENYTGLPVAPVTFAISAHRTTLEIEHILKE